MNDTDVQATNTDCKSKLHKNYKRVLQIWLVNLNVVPGSTKMLIQEHVALGKIRFCHQDQCLHAKIQCDKYFNLNDQLFRENRPTNEIHTFGHMPTALLLHETTTFVSVLLYLVLFDKHHSE